jgi:hypothetical protein
MRTSYNLLALLLLSGAAAMAAPMQGLTALSGTLVSWGSSSVVIKTATGNRTVAVGPTTRFFALDKSSLANVGQGSFIGTTVVPQPNGTYKSTEVHIFAPSLRGTGEGFTKMDSGGNHMMANNTVQSVEMPKMMANSTVRTVGSNGPGKTITMTFPSGTKTIVIPADVPVYSITKGSRTMLIKGAPVSARVMTGPHGLAAGFLLVGLHGTVPPM